MVDILEKWLIFASVVASCEMRRGERGGGYVKDVVNMFDVLDM